MTLVVEETHTTSDAEVPANESLARWRSRVLAFVVDVLPAAAVVATMALVSLTVPPRSAWWWSCMSVAGTAFLLMLVNRLLLPAITGWSLGRALCGIAVVRRDGEDPGPWRLLVRDLAHLLDTASLFVGWLWPLWDSRRRTFADLLLRTEVQRRERHLRPRNVQRWTALAILIATILCVDGAQVSYTVAYSRDRAADQTRAAIAVQGPKMVAQMLTYDPTSLRDDFARARSLTTDRYRGQLAAQQDAVEKGHPVINEYWVLDSSIQEATPDRATILVFMQGRRGVGPEQRYITASVRASFVKDKANHWLVDDLIVLAKPRPAAGAKK